MVTSGNLLEVKIENDTPHFSIVLRIGDLSEKEVYKLALKTAVEQNSKLLGYSLIERKENIGGLKQVKKNYNSTGKLTHETFKRLNLATRPL